jgi:hypothetical protein
MSIVRNQLMPIPAFTAPTAVVKIGFAMARCVLYESFRRTAERQTLLALAERVVPCTLGKGSHESATCPSLPHRRGARWRVGRRFTYVPTRHPRSRCRTAFRLAKTLQWGTSY